MAGPTPVSTVKWDGVRGAVNWYAAWGAATADNLTDAVVVDVSALSPAPTAIKIRTISIVVNGDLSATLESDNVATGTVNTTTANTRATWVSGDKFDTNWVGWGNSTITINGTAYTITSVDSTTQITLASDPGDQSAVAYTVDEFFDRFTGQSDLSNPFDRDYTDGPNKGITSTTGSSSLVGDLLLTTANSADGDEISLYATFERME